MRFSKNDNHEVAAEAAGAAFLILALVSAATGQSWVELAPSGTPPPSAWSQADYDAANNRLIVYVQGNPAVNPSTSNQVWVLAHANGLGGSPIWTQLLPTGTPPMSNALATAVYDAPANRLVIYGGCYANCSPPLSNVFVLSHANGLGGTPAWSEMSVTNPQMRAAQSAVYDPGAKLMIAFGGHFAFYGTDQNDTRILSNANGVASPSTWNTISPAGGLPGLRDSHTAIYDQANNRMAVFAGANLISTCCPYSESDYNDTWVLSNANGLGGTPSWTPLQTSGTLPRPRSFHSAVYDSAKNRMIVFGGFSWDQTAQNSTPLGDLWQLANANGLGGTPVWTQLWPSGKPPGLLLPYSSRAAFDSVHQRMIIIGQGSTDDPIRVWLVIFPADRAGECNVTNDTHVNIDDINLIMKGRGTRVAPGDPRDVDGDLVVTANDARMCVLKCDKPLCAR